MIALWRLAVLLPLAGPALAADVYQWVDRNGATHYGEVVPAEYKASARRVETGGEPTPEQRQDAEARALRDQEAARRMEEERKAQPTSPPVPVTAASKPAPPNETACEREWRLFAESNECFAPYMMANGAISPEAFKKCTEVKAPTCGPVPAKPATGR